MRVYVLSKDGKPLMPTKPRRAKLMLRDGRAKVYSRIPFTIKLTHETKNHKQPLTLGVNLGSKFIGSVVTNNKGNVVYGSEVELRNDITDRMKQRAKYHRNRRNRKTRYRKPRFLNRRNSIRKDRLNPTVKSKLDSHLKEIKFVCKILPITNIIIETTKFDTHKLKDQDVEGVKYQQGDLYGYTNAKEFVRYRDKHQCQYCKGKSKCKFIEVHHIIWRSRGGEIIFNTQPIYFKKCVSYSDVQKTKGIRSEQHIPTGKIQGFRKFDKVLYERSKYFIKGRMSSGYAILMNIKGEKQEFKPIPKFNKMKRLNARKAWIIQAETIQKVA